MDSPYGLKGLTRFAARFKPAHDGDLLFVLALLWLTSVAVVIKCVASRDVLGAEATVALLVIVGLPRLALRGWLSARARRRDVSSSMGEKAAALSRSPFKDTL